MNHIISSLSLFLFHFSCFVTASTLMLLKAIWRTLDVMSQLPRQLLETQIPLKCSSGGEFWSRAAPRLPRVNLSLFHFLSGDPDRLPAAAPGGAQPPPHAAADPPGLPEDRERGGGSKAPKTPPKCYRLGSSCKTRAGSHTCSQQRMKMTSDLWRLLVEGLILSQKLSAWWRQHSGGVIWDWACTGSFPRCQSGANIWIQFFNHHYLYAIFNEKLKVHWSLSGLNVFSKCFIFKKIPKL